MTITIYLLSPVHPHFLGTTYNFARFVTVSATSPSDTRILQHFNITPLLFTSV